MATVPTDVLPIHGCDFTKPSIIIVGNERKGVTDEMRALCDVEAAIPMSGSAESLNSAVATSIVLYEACRQRATQA